LRQTHQDLLLVIRDDGSKDKTLELIGQCNDPRIIILNKEFSSLSGHVANFSALVAWAKQSDYPYFCFCDQDDIWLPNKIEITLQALTNKVLSESKPEPVLVHADLEVVDEALKLIAGSFLLIMGYLALSCILRWPCCIKTLVGVVP
jgi:rhamnosyltransferase